MQMPEMASVEVSGPSGQTKDFTFRQTQHQDVLTLLFIHLSAGHMTKTKLTLKHNLFSLPYASFAWCSVHNTTQVVGH